MVRDVIIIGSGPAGLTAGIYMGRVKRKPLIIEGSLPGGQLMTTGQVENWPGDISIDGPALISRMQRHAKESGCTFLADTVVSVDFSKAPYIVVTKREKLLAKSIIITTGASTKKLHCPGEEVYWGKGVNICAICDAPFYEGKEVVVVGGGNSAIAESYALSKYAKQVTIIQLLDHLTATDPLKDTTLAHPNVKVLCSQKVTEIIGTKDRVTGVIFEDQITKTKMTYPAQGVFIAIGTMPNSAPFQGQLEIDTHGYIVRHDGYKTSKQGIFVAGDVTDSRYRQAIASSGQGCAAALECEAFLQRV